MDTTVEPPSFCSAAKQSEFTSLRHFNHLLVAKTLSRPESNNLDFQIIKFRRYVLIIPKMAHRDAQEVSRPHDANVKANCSNR